MARNLMSDEEWVFFEHFIRAVRDANRRRPTNHRLVLDGIFWIARTGAPWRDLPTEFGKWSSVQALLHKSDNRGFTLRIHALGALHEQAISHALSYDELVQLQRIAAKAGVPADLGRRGHDRARAS